MKSEQLFNNLVMSRQPTTEEYYVLVEFPSVVSSVRSRFLRTQNIPIFLLSELSLLERIRKTARHIKKSRHSLQDVEFAYINGHENLLKSIASITCDLISAKIFVSK